MPSPIIGPVVGLTLWTFLVEGWMYATRLPALAGKPMPPTTTIEDINKIVPPSTRWKADNYNHLHEQPTVFYALALSLAHVGASQTDVRLAWTYVGIRVLHTLVQCLGNKIILRFQVFISSSAVLLAIAAKLGLALYKQKLLF
ncbi:hypothetical protein EJ06DRAFT_527048 [Trichodelitschia bisporula]|uniref:Membrane-associated proteins in eicosanoid and glutathione metabolism n=1 Tax=Trichodelitschia bisporula TaxID=703511 RepID=A0A6G1I5V2_9PEZI|nr:hypothetical protein EJ06DRAFT_527048 [Trichodelitschia bisporula]